MGNMRHRVPYFKPKIDVRAMEWVFLGYIAGNIYNVGDIWQIVFHLVHQEHLFPLLDSSFPQKITQLLTFFSSISNRGRRSKDWECSSSIFDEECIAVCDCLF